MTACQIAVEKITPKIETENHQLIQPIRLCNFIATFQTGTVCGSIHVVELPAMLQVNFAATSLLNHLVCYCLVYCGYVK